MYSGRTVLLSWYILDDYRPLVGELLEIRFQCQVIVHRLDIGWQNLTAFANIHAAAYILCTVSTHGSVVRAVSYVLSDGLYALYRIFWVA